MLRLYKPIKHEIFKLHKMVEHLVCFVLCEADNSLCQNKLEKDFLLLYNSYSWLRDTIDEIYLHFKGIPEEEKISIKNAFIQNNRIEDLCNGIIKPIYIDTLNKIVNDDIKPLLINFYEELLERAKVPGTKKKYYEELIKVNDFVDCPCCGLVYFESESSSMREEFDHYLPKSIYPFSSVNFDNLVPLCHKCNAERKHTKDPIENGAKAFYPYSCHTHNIDIKIDFDSTKDLRTLEEEDVVISFLGDKDRIETWNRLFEIESRYNEASRRMLKKSLIREVKIRHKDYLECRNDWTYTDTLNKLIKEYKDNHYLDKKFLKIPILEKLIECTWLIDVYENEA